MSRLPRTGLSAYAGMALLDIAVALVVSSILLVAALRGSELITSARVKRIGIEISNTTAAFLIYQDRYRAMAGDDANAATRWAEAKNGNGDGVLSGHYDDPPPVEASALVVDQTQGESLNAWWHLRLAGLVSGPQSGSGAASPPVHALGALMGIQQGAFGMRGRVLCLDGIDQQIASALDRQIDDSQPGSGSLRAGTLEGNLAAYQLAGSDLTVCVSLGDSARAEGPGPLYPALAVPNAPANGPRQSVAPGGSGNGGQRNGQNGMGPGNNGNGNGNTAQKG